MMGLNFPNKFLWSFSVKRVKCFFAIPEPSYLLPRASTYAMLVLRRQSTTDLFQDLGKSKIWTSFNLWTLY